MKSMKMDNVVLLGAIFVLGLLWYNYNQNKSKSNMSNVGDSPHNYNNFAGPSPSLDSLGQQAEYAKAGGVTTNTYGLKNSQQLMDDPSALLPNDTNKEWANLNPQGNGNLKNANLLSTSFLIGADTIGSTKKNMNLQLRSEPIIPQNQMNTGPWLQSTIDPDLMRRPLEIGQGAN